MNRDVLRGIILNSLSFVDKKNHGRPLYSFNKQSLAAHHQALNRCLE